jgi:GT2 family glycosyltransferase
MALARGAKAIFLLNDDVTVHPKTLSILTDAENKRGPGIYAPEIWPYEPARTRTRFTIDWKKRLVTRVPVALNGPLTPIDYAEGSAVLISAATLGRIGTFDEAFGFYYEDADLSVRASEAGFPVCEVEGARVWHKGSVSAGRGLSPFKAYYRARNTLRFARKHRQRAHLWRIAIYHFGVFLVPAAVRSALGAVIGRKVDAERLSALVKGTWHLLTGDVKAYMPRTLPDITEQIARLHLPRPVC